MITRRALFPAAAAGLALFWLTPALAADRLNPNKASSKQLAGIGVAPQLIDRIQQTRPFATMVEFNAVVRQLLSADDAEKLYEKLFIPINLNTGKREEIMLIPGMSSRMVREFLEYRPYADISVFNREIGKYVDDAEVARLRSYVTL